VGLGAFFGKTVHAMYSFMGEGIPELNEFAPARKSIYIGRLSLNITSEF
jgi:hypothetical protein